MPEDDASYYRRRALEEQIAGQKAASDAARYCHEQLAAMYRFRAAMLSQPPACWPEASRPTQEEAAAYAEIGRPGTTVVVTLDSLVAEPVAKPPTVMDADAKAKK